MSEFFSKGGPLVWLLLAISIVATGIFAERMFYFHRASIAVSDLLLGISNLIRKQNFAEALHESASTPGPVARVVHGALLRHNASRSELKEIVQELGQLEVPKLERYLALLLTLANVSPLIGLLGTVMGLLQTFLALTAQNGVFTTADLAGGIYQSLLTSAAGLIVGIPAFAGHSYLSARVDSFIHDIERAGIETVNLLSRHANPPGIIEFEAPARRVFKES